MPSKKPRLWVMHSGRERKAHSLFVKDDYLSLAWPKCGDLRLISDNRKKFGRHFRRHYPDDGPAAAKMRASELYRFLYKMAVGDFVVYPSGTDGLVRVGRVAGEYKYKHKNPTYRHVRKVKWFKTLRRNKLSSKVKRALSGRASLYQPRKHASLIRENLLP